MLEWKVVHVRNPFPTIQVVGFSFDLLSTLSFFVELTKNLVLTCIDTLGVNHVIWKREDRHDGEDLCLDLRVPSQY